MIWKDHHLSCLRQALRDGLTAEQAAAELNRCFGLCLEKNAIVGAAHRNGIPFKRNAGFPASTPEAAHRSVAPRGRPRLEAMRPPSEPTVSRLDPASVPVEQRRRLVDLGNEHCRFPFGDVGTPSFFFCGAVGADMNEGVPYCPPHCEVAFR